MMLYLIRHAKAEEKGAKKPDEERKLTPKGKSTALNKAKKLRKKLKEVSLILTSPYPRALETAEIFAGVLSNKGLIKQDKALTAKATAADILEHLQSQKINGPILLIGHEPWMTQLASLLIAKTASCRIRLKKTGLIAIDVTRWEPGGGELWELR